MFYAVEGRPFFPKSKTGVWPYYSYILSLEAKNILPPARTLFGNKKLKDEVQGLDEFMKEVVLPALEESVKSGKDIFIYGN